eukprot:1354696-Amorphochlora_amoeboformis.AAC.1
MLVVCMDCLPRAFRLQIRKGIGLVQHPRGLICLKRFVQRRHRASFVQPVSAEEILSRSYDIKSTSSLGSSLCPKSCPTTRRLRTRNGTIQKLTLSTLGFAPKCLSLPTNLERSSQTYIYVPKPPTHEH